MSATSNYRSDELNSVWLGTVDYGSALEIQRSVHAARKSNSISDSLLLLEHPHVLSLGRRADESHILTDRAILSRSGVEIHETDRGGEATYHGPGQLIGYPIIDVRAAGFGPVTYVRMLENAIIDTLKVFGVDGHTVNGETGVWVGGIPGEVKVVGVNPSGKKIAAIGVRISGGVTLHGFAINVTTNVSYFQHIIPCGMRDLPISSIEIETGRSIPVQEFGAVIAEKLALAIEKTITWSQRLEVPV